MREPFKVAGEIKLMTVSQRQMSAALGLSTTRINDLINEGVMIRDESTTQGRLMLLESLANYYLSRKTNSEGVNFWKERALHEKAKRELAELKLLERRGELYEAAMVDSEIAEMLTDFRNKLQGVGHKIAGRLEGKSAGEICEAIDEEISEILEELTEDARQADYTEPVAEESEGDGADDGIGMER